MSGPVEHAHVKCELHERHSPAPLWTEKHHIQPRGMGGPDQSDNWLMCCPTGHYNIHALMGPLANGPPMPAGGTEKERQYAQLGYDRWVAAGRPGNPHAAYALHGPAEA